MTLAFLKFIRPAWRAGAAVLFAVCLASACGGGVDSGGTGAPAQSFASGRIAGFGSVIVNGVRYDDSNAVIVDDEGVAHPRSDLKLGMVVDVEAGPIADDPSTSGKTGVAHRIQFGSSIRGPVQSVDAAGSTMTVLGQTVKVDSDTVIEGLSSGLAGIHAGQLVEIHAFLDTGSGVYTATRIEIEATLSEFKLKGIVSQLDTGAKTFFIGNAKIGYAGVNPSDMPKLANGAIASVKLKTVQEAGLWVLSKATSAVKPIPDDAHAELEGYITDFASAASFKVDDTPVDASGVVEFKKGSINQLANGVRIEVQGVLHDGVLRASEIEFKNGGGDDKQEIELHGDIESVNLAQQSFVLRSSTVVFDASTKFSKGSASDLAAGAEVEVRGVVSGNGTQVLATEIRIEKKK
jgi:hypothetical protein